ncbi:MAG: glycoside hydrolase family 3 C-terminal domain-containing protein [Clostridiales bacterium]|nr:glycoside hydrolase family 3 C-terminal domain-containing protein [Clostridiales bacterium]
MNGKKGLSNKKAIAIFVPIIAVLLVLMIVATTLMNIYSSYMDNIFGQGEVKTSSAETLEASYYEGILDEENTTKEGSKAYAEATNAAIVSEGAVLLKNEDDALPLASDAKVTLLGANFNLTEALEASGMSVLDLTVDAISSGLIETGWDDTADIASYSDAAIVTIYRSYGEGNDASTLASDGVRTELSLSEAELELLDLACQNFDNVVVLIASSNVVEASYLTADDSYTDPYYNTDTTYDFSNIKAAMWLSSSIGDNGAEAVADLLNGTENPSGRLTDTYVSDFRYDPTYYNNGDYVYTNGDIGESGYGSNPTTTTDATTTTSFIEYEEGIYSGYRYYETAYYEAENGNYDGFDYDEVVVYPFGYGLSYTEFEMEFAEDPTYDESTNEFTFTVTVTNTGDVAGKQVVEIYCNTPYIEGGVEKAQVVLVGYAKTSKLEPGASETVSITIDRDYICSYDYKDEGCYILDAGDYHFYLSENAHSWADIDEGDTTKCWTYTLDEKIVYDEDNKRESDEVAATNQMDDVTNWKFTDEAQTGTGYAVNFSRSDFAGTFPTSPEGDDYVAQDQVLEARTVFDAATVDTTVEEIVITDSTSTSYTLADMRGVDYDDEMWDDFIEQLSLDKLVEMYSNGNWQEVADGDNGIPRTIDLDGPAGLTAQSLDTADCQSYQANIVIGATWNTEMAAAMGTSIANEMMAYGYTGWYGPGMNVHRSAFCGRNGEYYSEDSLLSGMMASAEISAASEGGVICYVKHFAVNNQETNRQGNLCTWVNEQALREVYLRGWEYYVKECTMTVQYYETDENGNQVLTSKEMSAATGIMTSYNLIGATWTASCTELTVNILRDEWGFTGTSLTDAINNATEYMDATAALYSGATDLCLSQVSISDYDNDYAIQQLQASVKNILYNKANSNALELNDLVPGTTLTYGMSPWQVGLIVAWAVVAVICAGCVIALISIFRKNKKTA